MNFLIMRLSLDSYIKEIVRSYKEISSKKFLINLDEFNNKVKSYKSPEIVYGLRNFIGNANKFSNKKIQIILLSDSKETEIIIKDDGPGFPKDLIDKERLGRTLYKNKRS